MRRLLTPPPPCIWCPLRTATFSRRANEIEAAHGAEGGHSDGRTLFEQLQANKDVKDEEWKAKNNPFGQCWPSSGQPPLAPAAGCAASCASDVTNGGRIHSAADWARRGRFGVH